MKTIYSISTKISYTGASFYNPLFLKYNLDMRYMPLETTNGIGTIHKLLRDDKSFHGCSVSMPFKKDVVRILYYKDPLVTMFESCNTILNVDGKLHGFNTDYFGAMYTLSFLEPRQKVSILGSGSMGQMYKRILQDRATVYSRSIGNWDQRHAATDTIVNCTALGTISEDSPLDIMPDVGTVIDLSVEGRNQLEQQCFNHGVKYIRGADFYKKQFVRQFEFYSGGISITPEEMDEIRTL
jgi:shikimate dehydrogenase